MAWYEGLILVFACIFGLAALFSYVDEVGSSHEYLSDWDDEFL